MTTEGIQQPPQLDILKAARGKIIAGLKRHGQHLVGYGQQMHEFYPPGKIEAEVFEKITVPIPLHIAMMLYGLAATELQLEALAGDPAAAKEN